MQENPYSFHTNNSSDPNGARQQYEYVFTGNDGYGRDGGGEPPRKNNGGRFAVKFLAAILGIAILFGGGYGLAVWNASRIPTEESPEEEKEEGPIQQITPNGDALHATPEDFLLKTEPTSSPFGSAGEDPFAISDVVKMVEDAVVVIDTRITNDSIWGSSSSTGAGSGVVVSADGYILTCNHVIEGATEVLVTLNSGKQYEASLVGRDANTDLAVLKIEVEEPLVYVKHGSSADLIAGEYVVAIGNPLGTLGGTVTKGIISATERRIRMSDGTVMTLLQTDAAINSGNSGGGLFNLKGELIGIVNAKYTATGAEGLGFAIPVDTAYAVELDLIRYSYVRGVVDHGLTTVDIGNPMLAMHAIRELGGTDDHYYMVKLFKALFETDLSVIGR